MQQLHKNCGRAILLFRGVCAILVAAFFVAVVAPANASMSLGDEIYSAQRFNAGLYDWEIESSGWGISAISSTRNAPDFDSELPEPFWGGVRLPEQEFVPISSGMSGRSSSDVSNNGGPQGFGVLPGLAFALLDPVRLSWMVIERSLEVPLAPRFDLLRPPQSITFIPGYFCDWIAGRVM